MAGKVEYELQAYLDGAQCRWQFRELGGIVS